MEANEGLVPVVTILRRCIQEIEGKELPAAKSSRTCCSLLDGCSRSHMSSGHDNEKPVSPAVVTEGAGITAIFDLVPEYTQLVFLSRETREDVLGVLIGVKWRGISAAVDVGLGRRAEWVGLDWFATRGQYLSVCQSLSESA